MTYAIMQLGQECIQIFPGAMVIPLAHAVSRIRELTGLLVSEKYVEHCVEAWLETERFVEPRQFGDSPQYH